MDPVMTAQYGYPQYAPPSSPPILSVPTAFEPTLFSTAEQSSIFDFLHDNFVFNAPPAFESEYYSQPEELTANFHELSAKAELPPISALTTLPPTPSSASVLGRPLVTTIQKRENHIKSEKRRRDTIRGSYAMLSLLLEGPEKGPGSNRTLRGSSNVTREAIQGGMIRGKQGRVKGGHKKQGKAGTLFRAVEYAKWLREGNDVLRQDIAELKGRVTMGRW